MHYFWENDEVMFSDFKSLELSEFIPWEELGGKTILVTGATGLIGRAVVNSLIYISQIREFSIKLLLLVRNLEKSKQLFKEQIEQGFHIEFIEADIEDVTIDKKIDFIIHAACPTASSFFVEHPISVIHTSINGTENMLKLATKNCASMVYLSSMEAYGEKNSLEKITETGECVISTMNPRSSYPESKRMCELLCTAYYKEYGTHVKSIRLAQTFGPGVSGEDRRAFAEFARCALQSKDIILKTSGESKHPYLYIMDAVSAILLVLLRGKDAEVYNAANEDTFCSIKEMAECASNALSNGKSKVIVELDYEAQKKYPATNCLNLSAEKLRGLGWRTNVLLDEMFLNMCNSKYFCQC